MIRTKVCCITSLAEAETAINLGASALGLVSEMPSGPGVISEDRIAEIARSIPPAVASVLLTSQTDVATIVAQQRYCGTNTLQLCEPLSAAERLSLRAQLPGISLIQVVHVSSEDSVTEACALAESVDGILLDTGIRSGPDKQLGGTGRTHDWSFSARIVAGTAKPVFLAGGLRPGNVGEAVRTVKPYGVDVCSGVRTDGLLDEQRLVSFLSGVANA